MRIDPHSPARRVLVTAALQAMPPESVVGYAREPNSCPLATVYGVPTVLGSIDGRRLDLWELRFIASVDALDIASDIAPETVSRCRVAVSARQCLALLAHIP